MRFVILETSNKFKLVDLNKAGYTRQQRYILNEDDRIVGTVHSEFDDPMEAITELINLQISEMKKQILKEVKGYDRY